jgi:Tol biopolymer transport system component
MRFIRILPFLALFPLLGCDGAPDWLRSPGGVAAYAAPLASDTTVVTTRRVWSSVPGSGVSLDMGTIMPNGAAMAFADWRTRNPAVFHLASNEVSRLGNDEPSGAGVAIYPVPSPDGSQIAFLLLSQVGRDTHLRVVDVATGKSRTLLAPDTAAIGQPLPVAWTPAGDSVIGLTYPPDNHREVKAWLIPTAGGTPRLVHTIPRYTGEEQLSLSPDGRWLLYTHDHPRAQPRRSDIYIIDVQGGGARPLVEHSAVDLLVGWLPGTDVVLFSSDRSGTKDLWSVRVVNGRASGEPRLVRSGFFRSQAVGFGGGALFYRVTAGSRGESVVNVDPRSGALVGAPSPPLEHFHAMPGGAAWSPDGQTLAAVTRERGNVNAVHLHSMHTGERRMFWLDEGIRPFVVEWAADGTALFVRAGEAGQRVGTGLHHFLRLDLITGTTSRLFAAADPGEPVPLRRFLVTPDGRSIVLRQQRTLDDGRTEMKLVLRSFEDGSERELYRTSAFIPEFSLSADGSQLAFMQQVWEDSDSLFILMMDGSQPLRAVASWDSDEVSLLGWLPGKTTLLAARLIEEGKAEEILRIELDGSTTVVGTSPFRPMRGFRGAQGYYRSRLTLSPAGNRLLHNISDIGTELWRMDGLHELFAEEANGRR